MKKPPFMLLNQNEIFGKKKQSMKNTKRLLKGFSLLELLVAAGIFVLALVGILTSYIKCLELAEISKNTSRAVYAAKTQLEEIKNTPFTQIKAAFNNVAFTAAGVNGMGICYVDDTNAKLLVIVVTFSWRQANSLVVGADKNINGAADAGETTTPVTVNVNGTDITVNVLDSPVRMVSHIFERS